MSESTLVETARHEALHGSAVGCAGLVKNLADAVAALTAENERLRETLTLGLGEQESVIAGLRAENDRLVAALTDIAEPLAAIQRVADATGYKVNGMAVSLTNSAEHLRALARAALPSSRETTDG